MIDARRGLVLVGDCRERLRELPAESVQCVVTSPPYWQLRDYGHDAQTGLEATPRDYVETLVGVMREVRRVLRADGTLWVNLGDTYIGGISGGVGTSSVVHGRNHAEVNAVLKRIGGTRHRSGLPPKSMAAIPWRFAIAMQDDGWILRSEIIWHKPNPIPENVVDRPSRTHEHVFLLAKNGRYFYDADALRTALKPKTLTTYTSRRKLPADATAEPLTRSHNVALTLPERRQAVDAEGKPVGANARTVWTISVGRSPGKHTSTFPRELARRCIAAGSRPGDIVLDPFAGSGTTAEVALRMGRGAIAVELSPEHASAIEQRLHGTQLVMGACA